MRQENSSFRHRLFIDDEEVLSSSDGTISFTGNGQLNTLNVRINNVDLQYYTLFNKKIELFLNESGTDDSVPLFRGFVKRFTPSEKDVSLYALDVRSVLTGNDGIKINSTDLKNYDGKTVGQFIYEIVTDEVNYNETVIGLDMLTDTDIGGKMTGIRGKNLDVYKVIEEKINTILDKSDYSKPLSYFVDVKEGNEYSNIVITKEKPLTNNPSYTFSYGNGLQRVSHKKVLPLNTVYYNDGRVLKYTNRPSGQTTTSINDIEDVAEARKMALEQILLAQQENSEIRIDVSKCYDIGLGNLLFLDVPDDNVHGIHRVQAKKIKFGKKGISCQLRLNKKPVKLSQYIQKQDD
tara:strand:- start:488 stop:1534 length:1047 start_codon:yes stop_codon:yes gene_type:complete